jgi:hypothetical protein
MVGKKAIDYENTPITFYRFACNDSDIVSSYVGHTVSFRQRKNTHKNRCNNEKYKYYSLKIYQTIRDNGGWDNWKMIEIERRICVDKRDSERYEQKLIEELQADMNMIRAYRTEEENKEQIKKHQKQYNEKNKEQIIEYQKQYREKNKEQMKEHQKQYYEQNKEQRKEQKKQYNVQNKERIIEYQKQYREQNKEKLKEQRKEYYEQNKEQRKEYQKEYYENQKNKTMPDI